MKNESPTIMGFMTVLSMVFVSMVLVTSQTPAAFAGNCFEPGPDADCDGDGYTPNEGDCDENRSDIFPGQGCQIPPTPIEITFDVDDNIVVRSDDTVIISNGATVSGNIMVNGGTLVISEGVMIKGNIESKKGGTIEISDSTVEGNVESKTEVSLVILDSTIYGNLDINKAKSATIAGNTIYGNLDATKNKDLSITDNTVDGNLNIQNTSGSCSDSGNTVDGNFNGCP